MENTLAPANQAKETTAQVLEKVRESSSHILSKIRGNSASALEELQLNVPLYKHKLDELLRKIQTSTTFQLRNSDDVVAASVYIQHYDGIIASIIKLPAPACLLAAYLASQFLACLSSLSDSAAVKLLTEKTLLARLLAVLAVFPAYALSYHYERLISVETGMTPLEWTSDVWMSSLRRLPPAFYMLAAVNSVVTATAAKMAGEGLIKRMLALRLRTLAFFGTLYAIVKIVGVHQLLTVFAERLPVPIADAFSKFLKHVPQLHNHFNRDTNEAQEDT